MRPAATLSAEQRRRWGQYFTPPAIAEHMASLVDPPPGEQGALRILDPGAGHGLLGITAARRLLRAGAARVELVAVEAEPAAREALCQRLLEAEQAEGGRLQCTLLAADFLDLGGSGALPPFACAIANPPYFKLGPGDGRGGQAPNIYARFMEVAAGLLAPGGQLICIVPRSYSSGAYFRRFRQELHGRLSLERVHLFEGRGEAFGDQGVLQENIIAAYRRGPQSARVRLSRSQGLDDLGSAELLELEPGLLLPPGDALAPLRLPATAEDAALLRRLDAWPLRLQDLGLRVSTGPVVPFRARGLLVEAPGPSPTLPLLWMQHLRGGSLRWPLGPSLRHPEHMSAEAPARLLLPNQPCVLLRRFSPKEEPRRLCAAALLPGALPGPALGVENHLNILHRPGAGLGAEEALGLAAWLNSAAMDRIFRALCGHTQVNAAELRALPMPPLDRLQLLGRRCQEPGWGEEELEALLDLRAELHPAVRLPQSEGR